MKKCFICDKIAEIKNGTNPYFVKELKTGYIVLEYNQLYKGYVLFLCKMHAEELHELDKKFKVLFLEEMSKIAQAIYKAFKPKKMNYELLGNSEPHLHWHIIPRYANDPDINKPIWAVEKAANSQQARLTKKDLRALKKLIINSFGG